MDAKIREYQKYFEKIAHDGEKMADHTTFRIGGPIDLMLIPETESQIAEIVARVKNDPVPFMVLGNGSNLLVRDGGIRGIVMKISDNFSEIQVEGERIYAQAGALLSDISKVALGHALTGFEFAGGIPGTVGGAMVMNAGAYGGEMIDIVETVRLLDADGNLMIKRCDEMGFGYRKSHVLPQGWTVLGATFLLRSGHPIAIKEKIDDLTLQRETKQPLEYASAGSTFKRPEGYFAGKLIDDSGLRGFRYKDAQVSQKHCGFVINRGDASCQDVLTLIDSVKKIVREQQGIDLETEIKIIGEDLCE